ncbi:hypothetical protein M2318_003927 [Metapseudomonas resinovorans]|uniref:hypothetical protein n=1 Tax=Metapseudomonas resinovorans TaxID=53412 RepID=UPI003D192CB3
MATGSTDQTITVRQLCSLTGHAQSFFSEHRGDLPQPTPLHQPGKVGRPTLHYSLAELAAFALNRTASLSDAECRLIVALGRPSEDSQP